MRLWGFGRWRSRAGAGSREPGAEEAEAELVAFEFGLEGVAGEVVEFEVAGGGNGVRGIVRGGAGVAHEEGVAADGGEEGGEEIGEGGGGFEVVESAEFVVGADVVIGGMEAAGEEAEDAGFGGGILS